MQQLHRMQNYTRFKDTKDTQDLEGESCTPCALERQQGNCEKPIRAISFLFAHPLMLIMQRGAIQGLTGGLRRGTVRLKRGRGFQCRQQSPGAALRCFWRVFWRWRLSYAQSRHLSRVQRIGLRRISGCRARAMTASCRLATIHRRSIASSPISAPRNSASGTRSCASSALRTLRKSSSCRRPRTRHRAAIAAASRSSTMAGGPRQDLDFLNVLKADDAQLRVPEAEFLGAEIGDDAIERLWIVASRHDAVIARARQPEILLKPIRCTRLRCRDCA